MMEQPNLITNKEEAEAREIRRNIQLYAAVPEAQIALLWANPHAHLMYTVTSAGDITHYGIYGCKLEVNSKGQWRKQQAAPQLLGDLIPFDKYKRKDVGQLLHADAWTSAWYDVGRRPMPGR